MAETKLTQGMQSFGSTRGVSGHVQNPFAGDDVVLIFESAAVVQEFRVHILVIHFHVTRLAASCHIYLSLTKFLL